MLKQAFKNRTGFSALDSMVPPLARGLSYNKVIPPYIAGTTSIKNCFSNSNLKILLTILKGTAIETKHRDDFQKLENKVLRLPWWSPAVTWLLLLR